MAGAKRRQTKNSSSKGKVKIVDDNSDASSVETKVDHKPVVTTSHKRRREDAEDEDKKIDAEKLAEDAKRLAEDAKKVKEDSKRAKYWDSLLAEEYRKYRPVGYPLYLPKDTNKNIRVYCDGIYDLFHLGHMNQLKQCKQTFPNVTLVVGVPSDEVTWKNKGLTVLTDKQRCETLLHCKWVDEVIPNAPWTVSAEFMKEHKLDFVAHDDIPYASADSEDVYAGVKKLGKFIVTQRTDGISTSDIITKIIRDYDKYLMRNFARGASRQELNVSRFKKTELDIKKHIDEFRKYWKKTNNNLNNASKDLYYEVRQQLLRNSFKALKRINSSPSLKSLEEANSRTSPGPSEPVSPATEFAMNYNVNRNRSLIGSFKRWIKGDSDIEGETDSSASPEPVRKRQKVSTDS